MPPPVWPGTLFFSDGSPLQLATVTGNGSCSRRTCPVNGTFGEVAGDIDLYGQAPWLQSVLAVAAVTAVPEPQTYAMLLAGLAMAARYADAGAERAIRIKRMGGSLRPSLAL